LHPVSEEEEEDALNSLLCS